MIKPFIFEELIRALQAKFAAPHSLRENVVRWRDVSINPTRGRRGAERNPSSSRNASSICCRCFCASRGACSVRTISSNWSGARLRRGPNIVGNLHLVSARESRSPRRSRIVHPHRSRRRIRSLAIAPIAARMNSSLGTRLTTIYASLLAVTVSCIIVASTSGARCRRSNFVRTLCGKKERARFVPSSRGWRNERTDARRRSSRSAGAGIR